MKLVKTHRAEAERDWHIGYLDDDPAIGDHEGNWYRVTSDAVIHNPEERLVWVVKHEYGIWECIHDMHWQDQYVDPRDKWTQGEPTYKEEGE